MRWSSEELEVIGVEVYFCDATVLAERRLEWK